MCLNKVLLNPVPTTKPKIGYKVVKQDHSSASGGYTPYYYSERFTYKIGDVVEDIYDCEEIRARYDEKWYESGFHVFKYLKDARRDAVNRFPDVVIIKVKCWEIQVEGLQGVDVFTKSKRVKGVMSPAVISQDVPCFVCNKMKIEKEIG